MKRWIVAAAGLIAVAGLAGCSDWQSTPPSPSGAAAAESSASEPSGLATQGSAQQSVSGASSGDVQEPAEVAVEPTPDPVSLCRYYDATGTPINAPCGDPGVEGLTPAPPEPQADSAGEITCQTPCDSSACEQYKYVVLNCP